MEKFVFNSIIRISDIVTVLFLFAISFGDKIDETFFLLTYLFLVLLLEKAIKDSVQTNNINIKAPETNNENVKS